MIYPKFLTPGSKVGICAPSAGIDAEDHPGFDRSLGHLQACGWQITETASVRAGGIESAPGPVRADELNDLLHRDDLDAILCASGGDFLLDMRPFVDWAALRRRPVWVQGYSDPTGLLYPITTKLDIATVYGPNAGGFDMTNLHPCLQDSLSILQGKIPVQHSFDKWETLEDRNSADGYTLTQPVQWRTLNGDVQVQGRLIGGCMECLSELLGTPYDGTAAFLQRYGSEGILWYFDIFALRAEQVYNTLRHMEQAGWFQHAVGFVFGRVMFPGSLMDMTYEDAFRKALGDMPVVFETDIGHVHPTFTLINGSYATLTCKEGKGSLQMELK